MKIFGNLIAFINIIALIDTKLPEYYDEPLKELECLSGWILRDTTCYGYFPVLKSWNNALEDCKSYGAQLATVDDYGQNEFINRLAFAKSLTYPLLSKCTHFWIGLNGLGTSSKDYLMWNDNTVLFNHESPDDTNQNNLTSIYKGYWEPGQPKMSPLNSLNRDTEDEKCVGVSIIKSATISTNNASSSSSELQGQKEAQDDVAGEEIMSDYRTMTRNYDSDDDTLNPFDTNYDSTWTILACQTLLPFACEATACVRGYFRCLDGNCINQKFVCDGVNDCSDSSDEANCDEKNCNFYQSGTSGQILSPNYPSNYPSLAHCKWIIEGHVGTIISLKVQTFLTEETLDVLLIMGGSTNEGKSLEIARLSGHITPQNYSQAQSRTFNSPNHLMILTFITDDQIEFKGFLLAWEAIRVECNHELQTGKEIKRLNSLNYPEPYLNGIECVWVLTAPYGEVVTLEMLDFEFEMDYDYLEVKDGSRPSDPLLAKYTGTRGPRYIISTSSQLYIYLYTDRSIARKGFDLTYKTGCLNSVKETHGLLYSPGQGQRTYPRVQHCVWEINLNNPITLYIEKFDLHYTDLLRITTDRTKDVGGSKSSEVVLFDSGKIVEEESILLSKFHIESGLAKIDLYTDTIGFGTGYIASYSIDCSPVNELIEGIDRKIIINTQEKSFRTLVELTCPPKHKFRNGDLRILIFCKTGGKWNVEKIYPCIAQDEIGCGQVTPLSKGLVYKATNLTFGGLATYVCNPGFVFSSGADIQYSKCLSNGLWEPVPGCQAVKNCKPQYLLRNGFITLINGNGTSAGTILKLQCFKGFIMSGSPTTICLSTGRWSYNLPECKPIICPFPNIENAQINFKYGDPQQFIYGRSVEIKCIAGFRLNGPNLVTCNSGDFKTILNDSSLLTLLPICEDINECAENPYVCDLRSTICINYHGGFECACKSLVNQDIPSLVRTKEMIVDKCRAPSTLYPDRDAESITSHKKQEHPYLIPNLMHGLFLHQKHDNWKIVTKSGEVWGNKIYDYKEELIVNNRELFFKIISFNNSHIRTTNKNIGEYIPFVWCPGNQTIINDRNGITQTIRIAFPNPYIITKISLYLYPLPPNDIDTNMRDSVKRFKKDLSTQLNVLYSPEQMNGQQNKVNIKVRYSENAIDYYWLTNSSTHTETPLILTLPIDGTNKAPSDFAFKSGGPNRASYKFDFSDNGILFEPTYIDILMNWPKSTYPGLSCVGLDLSGCRRYQCSVDLDPCAINNGGCSHMCEKASSVNGYVCSCPKGWVLYFYNGTEGIYLLSSESGMVMNDVLRLNHTCVRKFCGSFPTRSIVNGQVYSEKYGEMSEGDVEKSFIYNHIYQNNDNRYYFMDKMMFECDVGFKLIGFTSSECSQGGRWTNVQPFPRCEPAFCKNIENQAKGHLMVISGAPYVSYGSAVQFKCQSPGFTVGRTAYSGHRFCMYNPRNISGAIEGHEDYWMSGTEPECKLINCGVPDIMPLSTYEGYKGATTYGSSFRFKCLSGGKLVGNSSSSDNVVRCDISGKWDYGNLRCTGPACTDPGTPLYGEQMATSYEIGFDVIFKCLQKGYVPSVKALQCVLVHGKAVWNITTKPVCLDREPPIFDDEECVVNETRQTGKFIYLTNTTNGPDLVNFYMPLAVDNSGRVVKYETDPVYFVPPFKVKHDMDITYKAYDEAGNVGMCILKIRLKDVSPPLITCPSSFIHYYEDGNGDGSPQDPEDKMQSIQTYLQTVESQRIKISVNLDMFPIIAEDDSGLLPIIQFNPYPDITVPINGFGLVVVTATDASNNTAFCSFHVIIRPKPCSIGSLLFQNHLPLQQGGESPLFRCYKLSSQTYLENNTLAMNARKISSLSEGKAIGDTGSEPLFAINRGSIRTRRMTTYLSKDIRDNEFETICEISCPQGYMFLSGEESKQTTIDSDILLANQIKYSCSSHRSRWLPLKYIPQCVAFYDSIKPLHTVTMSIQYRSANNDLSLGDLPCLSIYQNILLKNRIKHVAQDLSNACKRDGVAVSVLFKNILTELLENQAVMHFQFVIMPRKGEESRDLDEISQRTKINKCVSALQLILDLKLYEIRPLLRIELHDREQPLTVNSLNCPKRIYASYTNFAVRNDWCPEKTLLYWTFQSTILSEDFNDDDNDLSNARKIKRCIKCPKGTYHTNRTCKICMIGTYQDKTQQTGCKFCPAGMSTEFPNAVSIEDCRLMCIPGTYSLNGLVPCTACPKNTFSRLYGSPLCIPCPGRKITSGIGASSIDYCVEPCPAGYFSNTGQMPCEPCPQNFYQPTVGSFFCYECPDMLNTHKEASKYLKDCYFTIPEKNEIDAPKSNLFNSDHFHYNNVSIGNIDWRNSIDLLEGNKLDRNFMINTFNSESFMDLGILDEYSLLKESMGTNETSNTSHASSISPFHLVSFHNFKSEKICESQCWASKVCSDYTFNKTSGCYLWTFPNSNNPTPTKIVKRQADNQSIAMMYPLNRIITIRELTEANYCLLKPKNSSKPLGNFSPNTIGQQLTCTSTKVLTLLDVSFALIKAHSNHLIMEYDFKYRHQTNCLTAFNIFKHNKEMQASYETLFPQIFHFSKNCNVKSIVDLMDYLKINCEGKSACQVDMNHNCLVDILDYQKNKKLDGKTHHDFSLIGINLKITMDCVPSPCDYHSDICKNGGHCVAVNHRAICQCPPNYMGETCEIRLPYCYSDPCLNGGTCLEINQKQHNAKFTSMELTQDFTCKCKKGFSGSLCEIYEDHCINHDCQNQAMCKNEVNGFRCLCPIGFIGPKCQNTAHGCRPVNPCQNNAVCKELPLGRFKCMCQEGWAGQTCSKSIDDCSENPCGPNSICIDGHRRYFCKCPVGYTGVRCTIKISICQKHNYCGNNGRCYDTPMGYRCICNPGFSGQNCQFSIDWCRVSPCRNMATCINRDASFLCVCKEGFSGALCQHNSDDCEQIPCLNGGKCIKQPGGKMCLCTGGFKGQRCESAYDPCEFASCSRIGSRACVKNQLLGYSCECMPSYSGKNCDVKTKNDPCLPSPCLNGANCMVGNISSYYSSNRYFASSNFYCKCLVGWKGKYCQDVINVCDAVTKDNKPNPCVKNHAKCFDLFPLDYYCQCPIPPAPITPYSLRYAGKSCQIRNPIHDPCAGNPCKNGGTCNYMTSGSATTQKDLYSFQKVSSITCTCPFGSFGKFCEILKDPCEARPCQNGATCVNKFDRLNQKSRFTYNQTSSQFPKPNKYFCICPKGLTGFHCEVNPNDCRKNSCPYMSRCIDGMDTYTCDCPLDRTLVTNNISSGANNVQTKGCDKLVNDDFDLYFFDNNKNGSATFFHPQSLDQILRSETTYIENLMPQNKINNDASQNAMSFSLTVWVKFAQPEDRGTFLTMFDLSQSKRISGKNLKAVKEDPSILTMDQSRIVVSLFSHATSIKPLHIPYIPFVINDGNWHHITFIYLAGRYGVVIDSEPVAQGSNYGEGYPLPSFIKIVLGDAQRYSSDLGVRSKNGQGFKGYLTGIKLWNRALKFPEELDDGGKCRNSIATYGLVIPWTSFLQSIAGKVDVIRKSMCNQEITLNKMEKCLPSQTSLSPYQSGKEICSESEKQIASKFSKRGKPVLMEVPLNIRVILKFPRKETIVTWNDPTFLDAQGKIDKLEHNYFSGDLFTWGIYYVKYFAFNANAEYAQATFKISVLKHDCPTPVIPDNILEECELWGQSQYYDSKNCRIKCKNPEKQHMALELPLFYSCSEEGIWRPSDSIKCQITKVFVYPPCSDTSTKAREFLKISMAYEEMGLADGKNKICQFIPKFATKMKTEIMSLFHNLIKDNTDICLLLNCDFITSYQSKGILKTHTSPSLNFINMKCKPTKSLPLIFVDIQINLLGAANKQEMNLQYRYKLMEWLQIRVTNRESEFNILKLKVSSSNKQQYQEKNLQILPKSFDIQITPVCFPGSILKGSLCIKCAKGSYYDAEENKCKFCPLHTYQDKEGLLSCIFCPMVGNRSRTGVTICEGSMSVHDCKESCDIGYYYALKVASHQELEEKCHPCPVGFYQSQPGSFECEPCPIGFTTYSTGNYISDFPPSNGTFMNASYILSERGHQIPRQGCYQPCHCLNGGNCLYSRNATMPRNPTLSAYKDVFERLQQTPGLLEDYLNMFKKNSPFQPSAPVCDCVYPYGGARCEVIVHETCLPSCKNNQPCKQVEIISTKARILKSGKIAKKKIKKWKCICDKSWFGGKYCQIKCLEKCSPDMQCKYDELGHPSCQPLSKLDKIILNNILNSEKCLENGIAKKECTQNRVTNLNEESINKDTKDLFDHDIDDITNTLENKNTISDLTSQDISIISGAVGGALLLLILMGVILLAVLYWKKRGSIKYFSKSNGHHMSLVEENGGLYSPPEEDNQNFAIYETTSNRQNLKRAMMNTISDKYLSPMAFDSQQCIRNSSSNNQMIDYDMPTYNEFPTFSVTSPPHNFNQNLSNHLYGFRDTSLSSYTYSNRKMLHVDSSVDADESDFRQRLQMSKSPDNVDENMQDLNETNHKYTFNHHEIHLSSNNRGDAFMTTSLDKRKYNYPCHTTSSINTYLTPMTMPNPHNDKSNTEEL